MELQYITKNIKAKNWKRENISRGRAEADFEERKQCMFHAMRDRVTVGGNRVRSVFFNEVLPHFKATECGRLELEKLDIQQNTKLKTSFTA